ncbi:MAG: restriction endonuclease [Pseudobdellovibrio sp.]|nr:restriction endonuclease [Pseudobdellovibrio sp.]
MALWLVRAGSRGQQEQKCLDNDFVTIGWNDLPDLSKFESREALKEKYALTYPSEKEGAVNNRVGQVWHFSHSIKYGDLVALPLKSAPFIAFGEVKKTYQYTNKFGEDIRHIIPVKWLNKEVARKQFDQGLLYSFGAFMTVCRVERNHAEEKVRAVLDGKRPPQISYVDDATDTSSIIDLIEVSKNQIAEFINQNFKGHALEGLVEAILQAQGYVTDRTPAGADGGADILAGSGPMGFSSPRLLVEVKSGDASIGIETVDRLRGALEKFGADHGLLVSLSGYKSGVKKQCRDAYFKIRLWDQDDLLTALFKSYDSLPEAMQAQIPLQRSWTLVLDDEP